MSNLPQYILDRGDWIWVLKNAIKNDYVFKFDCLYSYGDDKWILECGGAICHIVFADVSYPSVSVRMRTKFGDTIDIISNEMNPSIVARELVRSLR